MVMYKFALAVNVLANVTDHAVAGNKNVQGKRLNIV